MTVFGQSRVKKGTTAITLTGVVLLVLLGMGVTFDAARVCRMCLALEEGWRSHWPLARGKYLPERVRSFFVPFAAVQVKVEPGISMLLDADDFVSRTIIVRGVWEPRSWAGIEKHLPGGGTFVDVGAHIGYYSLKAAKVVGSKGRVIAVEPNPQTVEKLRENIRLSAANITVYPVACSDSEATLELFAAPRRNTGESSLSRQNAEQEGTSSASYRVRARPLDAIIEESGLARVDVVKIDVEGAELLVLKGAKQALSRYSPVLIVEIIDRQLRAMGTSAAEVEEYLRSLGYMPRLSIGRNIEFAR